MNSVYGMVAGIDVHKRMLAVVIALVNEQGIEYRRRMFGTTGSDLRQLKAWLEEHGVSEVAMESTAQYWRPVWLELEGSFRLHLAQRRSTEAPRGRKSDFKDAERIVRRMLAQDLTLSYVPEREQREWRELTRLRVRLSTQQVRVRNQMEGLLEECRIKLSSVISDLMGASGRKILWALAQGETDAAKLAELADYRLAASPQQLQEALRGSVSSRQRVVLRLLLEHWTLLEQQIQELEREAAQALKDLQPVVQRLMEVPGISVVAAHQIVAEVGPQASAFATAEKLASWVGVCPGTQESAGTCYSNRSAKGNKMMRRLLTQCAWAAIKVKGSIFQHKFQALLPRLGPRASIWAIAHRLLRVIWTLLHHQVSYHEKGATPDPRDAEQRRKRYVRQLRKLGWDVHLIPSLHSA